MRSTIQKDSSEIGRSPYRIDAPGKVTGATQYPGDLQRDNFLHGKVVFTGQPHARLLALDLSAALAVPGVVRILTSADVPCNEYGLMITDQPVFIGPSHKPHTEISLWEGDHLAFVVAETEQAAETARDLIRAEWEPLPLLRDPLEAFRDELILHQAHGSNILLHDKIRKGDLAAGWAAAEVIVEGRYRVPHQEHAYLQPEAGISYLDEAGRITVEVGGQWAHEDQHQIAHALALPPEKIRVIYPATGGAFGGREDMSVQIVLALATLRLAEAGVYRPIRTIWTREESIIGHHKRHEAVIDAKWGATRDGKITAVEATVYLNAGAYNYTSTKVLGNAHLTVSGAYEIPNARVDSYAIYTTSVPGGAYRGFGAPQGCFAAEGQMNKLAHALGLDPVEIRLKNALTDDSIFITQSPMVPGVSLKKVITECAAAMKEEVEGVGGGKSAELRPFFTLPPNPAALRRGRGFACAFKNVGYSFGFPERCEATIELYGGAEIERAVLYHAAADVGQGSHTALRQMAAAALDVPLERVQTVYADTAHTGDSGSVSASRMTFMAGNAIRQAAERALESWSAENRPATGHARYTPPPTTGLDPETGVCSPNFAYGYVAEAVDLTVDIETGHIQLDRVICANDVGQAINPMLVEGQIEGGVVQAQGYAITEDLQLRDGRILNPRFSVYLMPGIQDIPLQVKSVIVEEADPRGPWGARGMAEMPFIPLAPAVAAALHDATGVWFDTLPLTPSRVVARLREA
jgi:CO/xanthine dehydrogenase Mo-binding subunit